MEVKEKITLINKENEEPVRDYSIIDNALKLQDNVVISIHNYDLLEIYCGDGCDIEIGNCRDITIYCDNDCKIGVKDHCDIEIFAENDCEIIMAGSNAVGGRIVCGDNCRITCRPNVEIESGDNCTINCDVNCNVDCRNSCSIRGNDPSCSFEVHCLRDCNITCNKKTRIESPYACNITWVDDKGNIL